MTTAVATGGFSQAAFDEFISTRAGEPDWLGERRLQSWKDFEQANWPNNSDEEWMRTDIRMFHLDKFAMPIETPAEPSSAPTLLAHEVELAGSLRSVNGQTTSESLSEELAKQGVLFGGLQRMVREHPEKMQQLFDRQVVDPRHDRFSMLNAACWSGGTVLYVPKGVCIELPLHAISVLQGDGAADLTKTLIVLEDNAEATLLMETASDDANQTGLHCGSIEIVVGDHAKLRYVNLQNWGNKVWHFANQKATVGKQGRLQWTIGALGAKLAKVNQQVALAGEDAEAQVNGVMFTEGRQHLSYNTHQHHEAPYCMSDLLYKAALQDKSRTVWRGMIKVDEPAQRTNAYQRNDNLMLAASARADSIPGLEIEADDVRCTHGSTSGRVDDTQIFYAMTRGYTRQEAVRMIVAGFFQQVFDRITIESVRTALAEAISQRVQDLPEQ